MGAVLIGMGFAYFIYQKNQNLLLAGGIGLVIAVADYVVLIWAQRFNRKK